MNNEEKYTTMFNDTNIKKINEDTALRFDSDKPRMDLISHHMMEGMASVLAFGAKKYSEHNWRKGMKWGRTIGSLLRHTFKFMSGENIDPESKLPHVDHIACNAMFLCEYFRTKQDLDDRWKSWETEKS